MVCLFSVVGILLIAKYILQVCDSFIFGKSGRTDVLSVAEKLKSDKIQKAEEYQRYGNH